MSNSSAMDEENVVNVPGFYSIKGFLHKSKSVIFAREINTVQDLQHQVRLIRRRRLLR